MYHDVQRLENLWDTQQNEITKGMRDNGYYIVSFASGEIVDVLHSHTNYNLLDRNTPDYLREVIVDPNAHISVSRQTIIEDFFSTVFYLMTWNVETEGKVFTLHFEMSDFMIDFKLTILDYEEEVIMSSNKKLLLAH